MSLLIGGIGISGGDGGGGGGGTPGGANTSIQFNNGGAFGGFGTWDGTVAGFASGKGLSFAGAGANPITVVGGDDDAGDTALVIDNVGDGYVALRFPSPTDIYVEDDFSIGTLDGSTLYVHFGEDGTVGVAAAIGVNFVTPAVTASGSFQADSYKSGDGSAGIDTTVTTGGLVGKTMTLKDGLLTDFS